MNLKRKDDKKPDITKNIDLFFRLCALLFCLSTLF